MEAADAVDGQMRIQPSNRFTHLRSQFRLRPAESRHQNDGGRIVLQNRKEDRRFGCFGQGLVFAVLHDRDNLKKRYAGPLRKRRPTASAASVTRRANVWLTMATNGDFGLSCGVNSRPAISRVRAVWK